jgi:tetratricopeptide (TPR) repeat protein
LSGDKRPWIAAVVGIVVLAAILLLSSNDPKSPEGMTVVDSLATYKSELLKAHEMTKPIFEKVDNGGEPTDQEKATLLDAARIIDNADRFLPNRTVPFLGAGKAYQFAGQRDLAEARYLQCLANLPYDSKDDPAIKETGYEAHYRLSQIYSDSQDYKKALTEADAAVKGHSDAPDYLVAKASALIQFKRIAEARPLLEAALKLEPTHEKAKGLLVLISGQ